MITDYREGNIVNFIEVKKENIFRFDIGKQAGQTEADTLSRVPALKMQIQLIRICN